MDIANKQKEYHHEDHMVYSCQYHVTLDVVKKYIEGQKGV